MKHLNTKAYRERLTSLADAAGIELTDDQARRMLDHASWVVEQNRTLNLTSITEPDDVVRLHVLDSLLALSETKESSPGPIADLGTGAGFPGVPLAIASGREAVLIDSVAKKSAALQSYLESSGLSPVIRATPGRAEELSAELEARFTVVTFRAVAPLPSLVELATPLLMPGGRLVALKGALDEDELKQGEAAGKIVGLDLTSVRSSALPEKGETRTLVVFTRCRESTIDLPRRTGRAQKRPLG